MIKIIILKIHFLFDIVCLVLHFMINTLIKMSEEIKAWPYIQMVMIIIDFIALLFLLLYMRRIKISLKLDGYTSAFLITITIRVILGIFYIIFFFFRLIFNMNRKDSPFFFTLLELVVSVPQWLMLIGFYINLGRWANIILSI